MTHSIATDAGAADLLEELVAIPSRSTEEARAVEFFNQRLSDEGFACHVDEAGNSVAELGLAGPRVVLLGHIDTVPGHVPVRRTEDRLYGRGAVDAKGCLVNFAAATLRAHQSGALRARVQIVGCVEEEVPSSKGAAFRATQPAPELCLVGEPSHWDRVTLGYKGYLRAKLGRTRGLSHTAAAEASIAAEACRLWSRLEAGAADFNVDRNALYDQFMLHLNRVTSDDDGRFERAELEASFRLPEDLGPEAAQAWIAERSEGWALDTVGGVPAWSGARTSPLARSLARSIARTGGRARFQRKTGTADLNRVAPAWGCPAAAYGPGDSALDHTPDEYIELDELRRSVAVLSDWLVHGVPRSLANGNSGLEVSAKSH